MRSDVCDGNRSQCKKVAIDNRQVSIVSRDRQTTRCYAARFGGPWFGGSLPARLQLFTPVLSLFLAKDKMFVTWHSAPKRSTDTAFDNLSHAYKEVHEKPPVFSADIAVCRSFDYFHLWDANTPSSCSFSFSFFCFTSFLQPEQVPPNHYQNVLNSLTVSRVLCMYVCVFDQTVFDLREAYFKRFAIIFWRERESERRWHIELTIKPYLLSTTR